jgi:hypothetical protein
MTAVAFVALLAPLSALAQTPKPSPAPPATSAPPAAALPPAKDAPKAYVPGLEQFMNVIQSEHAKLWYAGSARNWPLAAYQLGEIKEVMSDAQDLVPTFKNLPLDKMLDAVITGEIAELEKAIDAQDEPKFTAGYGKLTQACNACHQATGNGFVVIQRPVGQAFPNQDFRPQK